MANCLVRLRYQAAVSPPPEPCFRSVAGMRRSGALVLARGSDTFAPLTRGLDVLLGQQLLERKEALIAGCGQSWFAAEREIERAHVGIAT